VGGDRAARDDERRAGVAVGGAQRDPRQVEDVEDVGVGHLVLEREADDVEGGERACGLQRQNGQPPGTQLGLHVDPRCERALAGDVGAGVEQAVEDAGAEVAHPDVVEVGKREAD
jgi:hypothetical protein